MIKRLSTQITFVVILAFSPFVHAALPLWVLETDDTTIFILGSIHALKPSAYPLAAPIEQAYQQADTVVFEVDLMETSTIEMSRVMQEKGMYGPTTSLDEVLSADLTTQLQSYLTLNGLNWGQIYRMRPWLLNLTISQQELDRLGYDAKLGIDQHFLDRAYSDGKVVESLESFQQQIDILAGDSTASQVAALKMTLDSIDDFGRQIDAFLAAWREGDADKMLALTLAQTAENELLSEQSERMIFERNQKMAEQIHDWAGTGKKMLVIVGALHMGGDRGVIKLLQADYEVRQISH